MQNRKFGAFSSSVDPNKLASTIEGLLKLLGGLAVYFGFTTITGEINTITDQIGVVVTSGYAFYGGIITVFGAVRKIVVALTAKF